MSEKISLDSSDFDNSFMLICINFYRREKED